MKYNGWLPEGVSTSSKLAAYVNLNNQIESINEKKKTKKARKASQKTRTTVSRYARTDTEI